ncbi:MAG: class I SAM-dependent methyltransferase [Maricaulaceae bacterium]
MENARTFGAQADTYAAARPSYPETLFDWIAKQAPAVNDVWDVGTGSGQAALSLAEKFKTVHASDIDAAQIQHAAPHPNIHYSQAPAHASNLPDNSVDAITVATALHWFDWPLFWEEVRRVSRPGAIFCAWTYHRAETEDDIQNVLIDPTLDILTPYWSEGNHLSWRGYCPEELGMPFTVIDTPKFTCELQWTPAQIAAFMRSWSAHKKARLDGHEDALNKIEDTALKTLGKTPRAYALPLNILTARI